MTQPRDHVTSLAVQLRSDMTTLANVSAKVRVNSGSAATYTSASSPAIAQSADCAFGYQLDFPAATFADGDVLKVTWLYDTGSGPTAYTYDTEVVGPADVDGAHYTTSRGDKLDELDAAVSTRLDAASYTDPTVDLTAILTELALIKANTDLLGTGIVTFGGPVLNAGRVEIVQGDDYLEIDGRALSWTSNDWPDLTGATVTLDIVRTVHPHTENSYPADVISATQVDVELTAVQTADLHAGTWSFALKAILTDLSVVTLAQGVMVVLIAPAP